MMTVSDLVMPLAIRLLEHVATLYRPLVDPTIDFDQPPKLIADFSDDVCDLDFRFAKSDLQDIADQLWPRLSPFLGNDKDKILVANRYSAPYETCFLVYLFKMARPNRLRPECERMFAMRKSRLSAMINTFGSALFCLSQMYLLDPTIWHGRMEYYGSKIGEKCGLFDNVWGFIDGTIRRTCRPIRYQNLVYTRYKRCHGIKFQSLATPDGYIASLFGPFVAKRHDARML
jgi:hypothetical protein